MLVDTYRHQQGLNLLMKTHMPCTLEDILHIYYALIYIIDMKTTLY